MTWSGVHGICARNPSGATAKRRLNNAMDAVGPRIVLVHTSPGLVPRLNYGINSVEEGS